MTTKDFATYFGRAAEICERLRDLNTTITYKQFMEDIGLVPRDMRWADHFNITGPVMRPALW